MTPLLSRTFLALLFSAILAGPSMAQQEEPAAQPPAKRPSWESWLVLEEESAPEPPLLRLNLGLVAWLDARTSFRSDRGTVPGTELEDLEQNQGLNEYGISPWLELSLGGKVRAGGDVSYVERRGQPKAQDETVFYDGVLLAAPGDYIQANFEFLTIAGFVEWDLIDGRTYRLGLLGGARYFRIDVDLTGVRRTGPHKLTRRVRAELLSPYFGGLFEVNPFPYLDVRTQIQFMNWSWQKIGLKEARFFELRLGATVNFVPDLLGLTLEYRFLVIRAQGRAKTTGGGRIEGALLSNGLSVSLALRF